MRNLMCGIFLGCVLATTVGSLASNYEKYNKPITRPNFSSGESSYDSGYTNGQLDSSYGINPYTSSQPCGY